MQSNGTFTNIANSIPKHLIPNILSNFNPVDLYQCMNLVDFRNYIEANMHYFVNIYATSSTFNTEKFMWSMFNNPLFNKHNLSQMDLFLSMLQVHVFAKSSELEEIWEELDMNNGEFGPLPNGENELYNFKFQVGMLFTFKYSNTGYLEINAAKVADELYIDSILNTYTKNDNLFRTTFLVFLKYGYEMLFDYFEEYYIKLAEKGMDFETIDRIAQNIIKAVYGIMNQIEEFGEEDIDEDLNVIVSNIIDYINNINTFDGPDINIISSHSLEVFDKYLSNFEEYQKGIYIFDELLRRLLK